ncbi:bifunctional phosphoglucose/phosphomannose isomerase [Fodinibius halophilus]|uniref:Bifunctional phosphoglucose/phosphomannose isomerase n=1 Tax=Fodinibius halophilus TaxID=1736908 RepID=A0A6M1TBR1_9BACT|nr:bifunctional phosphoglucose/phosphomannose isomerase [Fodinibius halophilus]NGP89783.1 bifunctional phosphoglucose/phosphomannose isomerase [Fodinibius halophilus]
MDKKHIQSLDSQDMWQKLVDFPRQWQEAVDLTANIEFTIDKERIDKLCFVGMGGSASGGELIQAYVYDECPYPVEITRHYKIPGWVDENTLVVACSFSGNTEETLTALVAARDKGAQSIVVTSGGELMLKAAKEDIDYIKLPGGVESRTAIGYIFIPLYRIMQYLGIINESEQILNETQQFLADENELYSNPEDNEALNLAHDIKDTLPIFYSDAVTLQPVCLWWQNQFQQNAKTLAYSNTLPEMTHNEIVGWERVVHLTGRLSVIILKDKDDSPRVQRRMQIVEELIEDQTASLHIINSRGPNYLSRIFSLIQMADWTSFYLAMLSNIDPTPVTKIDLLKSKLSEA